MNTNSSQALSIWASERGDNHRTFLKNTKRDSLSLDRSARGTGPRKSKCIPAAFPWLLGARPFSLHTSVPFESQPPTHSSSSTPPKDRGIFIGGETPVSSCLVSILSPFRKQQLTPPGEELRSESHRAWMGCILLPA